MDDLDNDLNEKKEGKSNNNTNNNNNNNNNKSNLGAVKTLKSHVKVNDDSDDDEPFKYLMEPLKLNTCH